jgi:polysaccharide chain length determinant protein (PEP-CTERM system associated)
MRPLENPSIVAALEAVQHALRWWGILVAGAVVGLALGVATYRALPKEYQAATKIFVQPSQIPQAYVRSTVTDNMATRVAALQEGVLSRPYMMRIVEEVFGRPDSPEATQKLVNAIRSRIVTEVLHFDRREGAGLFAISFRDPDPERAAKVANMLAQLYIDENVKTRTGQAGQTAATLKQLADEVLAQLEERDQVLAGFRAEHLYELGDHMQANLQLLRARQTDLENNEQALAAARDKLGLLRTQRAEMALVVGGDGGGGGGPGARLARLREQRQSLEARYTEDHPAVRRVQQEIAALEEQLANLPQDEANAEEPTDLSPVGLEMRATERNIARLEQEQQRIRREIARYQRRIERTPQVQQEYDELSKGRDVLLAKYREYQAKYTDAVGSLRVEESRKGEQMRIVEAAAPPRKPVSPPQLPLYGLAAAVGMALVAIPLFWRYVVSPRIESRTGLSQVADVPVLVTIDAAAWPVQARARRRRALINAVLTIAGLVVLTSTVLAG